MRINSNATAVKALNQLNINSKRANSKMERLSSGLRINRAADDAAGLSISEQMRGQISGLERASTNAQDGISLVQTAEAALHETHEMLQRMRELAVQAANGAMTEHDRQAIQDEVNELMDEIEGLARRAEFNTISLLDGSTESISFQIGANAGQTIEVPLVNTTPEELGLLNPFDITADDAITKLEDAIKEITQHRAQLSGAINNRLEFAINNLHSMSTNLIEAESRIRDADMAKEMIEMTQANVLRDTAQAMLAQANQSTQSVLELLR